MVLLWGLFDDERSGPYVPVSGPIPLHRWRAFKRGKVAETAERLRALADQIGVPISALSGATCGSWCASSVVSRQIDDLEPTLMRHGYRIKDLAEQFDAKPVEIKALFRNALDVGRAGQRNCASRCCAPDCRSDRVDVCRQSEPAVNQVEPGWADCKLVCNQREPGIGFTGSESELGTALIASRYT